MKKVIITLLCIAILGGGGYAGAMKYKKNQDKKTVVAVVPVDLMAETADSYEWDSSTNMDGQIGNEKGNNNTPVHSYPRRRRICGSNEI
jgi:threonine dehydratase